jgi:hypothetical protein
MEKRGNNGSPQWRSPVNKIYLSQTYKIVDRR